MIHNEMLEGQQNFATLEDVDQGTVIRFIEWLYRGYYHAARPKNAPKPIQPAGNSESQKVPEGASTSSAFDFTSEKPTYSGIDATEALRGLFTASETPRRSLFGGTTPTATATAEPPRVVSSATNGMPRSRSDRSSNDSLFGIARSTQAPESSINANAPATSNSSERAARMAVENSVPRWQGPNPFLFSNEAPNTLGDSATSVDTRRRIFKDLNSSPNTVNQTHSQRAKELFLRRKYTVRQTLKSLPKPRRYTIGDYGSRDFSEVLLCHAYLHVFADKYDIQALKVLALEELHATLTVFSLFPERTGDILNLLSYVYKEAPEQADKMEDLRTLMTQYVDSEFETLVKDETLGTYLLRENEEFLEDLLKIIRKRLA